MWQLRSRALLLLCSLFLLGLTPLLYLSKLDLSPASVLQMAQNLSPVRKRPSVSIPAAPRFNFTAQDITIKVDAVLAQSRSIHDHVGSLEGDAMSFHSVLAQLAEDEATIANLNMYLYQKDFSRDKKIRATAATEIEMVSDYLVEAGMRKDVYRAVKAVYDAVYEHDESEESRLMLKTEQEYRRNGLGLSEEKQSEVKDLQKNMTRLSLAFNQNLGEDTTGVWFIDEDLEGIPKNVIDGWETRTNGDQQERKMNFKYPSLLPTTRYAVKESTRQKAWIGFESRCPENNVLMLEMLQLRAKMASLHNYSTFAEFVLDERMARNSANVKTFLDDLQAKLEVVGRRDLDKLQTLKKEDGNDAPFKSWDHAYYHRKMVEDDYAVDANLVAEYFEAEHTIATMLEIYGTLFSIHFVIEDDSSKSVWHPDARQYTVHRSDTQEFVGWLYMDLYPRDGKFGHAASFELSPGYTSIDGTRHYCATALICNFPAPTSTKPSLLKFDDVVTAFHELGHSMHSLLSTTRYAKFSGTSVERDFVETPSTMLENWCYSPVILERLSKHYTTGQPLPDNLIQSLIHARHANAGLLTLRQIALAKFDQHVHTTPPTSVEELTNLWNSYRDKISFWDSSPEVPAGEANFAHLMGGYEAGYYGYSYSRVFSADIFASKFRNHELDPAVGSLYRDLVLAPGSSKDASTLIHTFLGRPATQDAFLETILN